MSVEVIQSFLVNYGGLCILFFAICAIYSWIKSGFKDGSMLSVALLYGTILLLIFGL